MSDERSRVMRVSLGVSVTMVLVAGLVTYAPTAATADPAVPHPTSENPTDQQLSASRRRVASASAAVGVYSGRLAAAQTRLRTAQTATETAIENYNTAAEHEMRDRAAAATAVRASQTADRAVTLARKRMDQLVSATYKNPGFSPELTIMSGGDPFEMGHNLAVIDKVSGGQRERLRTLQQARSRSTDLRNAAQLALRRSGAAATAAQQRKTAAINAISTRSQTVTAIRAEQATLSRQLADARRTAGMVSTARTVADHHAAADQASRERALRDVVDDPENSPSPTPSPTPPGTDKPTESPKPPESPADPSEGGGGSSGGGSSGGGSSGGGSSGGGSSASAKRDIIIDVAMSQLGKPYVWAGAKPSVGFDCSGLVKWSYAKVGIKVGHGARMQYRAGTPIKSSQLERGDLVFWANGSNIESIHHVAIWAGDGKIIEAADFGVPVHKRWMYWSGYFGAVRLL